MTAPVSQQPVPAAVPEADAVIRTWGPPQTASWARGDTPAATPPPGYPSTGPLGARLHGRGPAGQPVAVTLLELVDPADFLYSAAGYRLPPGARAVVVHAELANHGNVPLAAQADAFLVLVASDGTAFGKAPTVLASRPPHPVAAMPGSLADGHTVYLVPEHAVINAVRWSAGGGSIALTWTV